MIPIVAETFTERHADWLTAIGVMVLAVLAVLILDRVLDRRAKRIAAAAAAVTGAPISRETTTRLRYLRRGVNAGIIIVGVAIALSQFEALDRVGRTILASGAIAAAVVGFAARQTLANAIAGILLAVAQPLRIGDLVTFEGETGTVEDVGLTYTWVRTGADARIVIPNERLAAGILRNDSIRSPTVEVEVSIWIGRDADETAALAALAALGVQGWIAESTQEGLRLLVQGEATPPGQRLAREGDLRRDVLRVLREAGVRGPAGGAGDPG